MVKGLKEVHVYLDDEKIYVCLAWLNKKTSARKN